MVIRRRWLVVIGVVVVAAAAKVGVQWEFGAPQQKRLDELSSGVLKASIAFGDMKAAEEDGRPPTPEALRVLLGRCVEIEAESLAMQQEYPDCIAAQYQWLCARNVTDRVANRLLIATLDQVAWERDATWPEDVPSISEQKELARRRALRRWPVARDLPLDNEYVDLLGAVNNFTEIRW